ncbi:angiopoietin-4-like [Penaeus japonicus]|uniref:angiopoietin-4-like n=1 Tax=Penaeus japonicus TaxID=27405 RepID=UPI001C70D1F0|nr:angiopoietin-4-like [Penaeus japonicus]
METKKRSRKVPRASLFLAVLTCSCSALVLAAAAEDDLRGQAFNTTLLDDPLEPIWNRLDGLSTDILRDFQSMIADIIESTSSSLEAKLQKLDTDVNTKFDAMNSNVVRKLNQVANHTLKMDASLQDWSSHYLTSVRQQIEASYQKVETVLGSKIAALENKVLEHINTKIAALMSFNLTLPQHSAPSTPSSSSSSTSSTSASTALSVEDSQSIVDQLNAKLVAIDAKLGDLTEKVNAATSTLSTINLHVAKINEREMDLDTGSREPGVAVATQGGSQGGSLSCQTLVDKVSELMDSQLSSGVINELESRLADMSRTPSNLPRDCSDVHWYNHGAPSGVYEIYPTLDFKASVSVWCDMGDLSQKDSGGWTVILRRRNTTWGLLDFNRTWDDYSLGFGNPGEGEWWFSLASLHALTYRQPYELRFLIHDIEQGYFTAQYDTFRVEDEGHLFRLLVDGFSGNISQDAFKTKHHGRSFSTWDRDNDNWDKGSCAINNGGGWWFNACHYTTLTAPFPTSNDRDARTIRWLNGDTWLVLDDVNIAIRPNNYALRFNAHNFE